MATVMFYIAEIFDYTAEQPVINKDDIRNANRLTVIPLDVHSLFD